MSPKPYILQGDLVTYHLWMIHLSECGGGVAAVGTWLLSNDTHDTRFLRMTGMRITDRARMTTRTMCGAYTWKKLTPPENMTQTRPKVLGLEYDFLDPKPK